MGLTYKVVEGTLLTATAATLYTAPSTVLVSVIRSMAITNNDATDRGVALFCCASGGTASVTTCIRSSSSNNAVANGKTELWDTQIFLAPSGFIQGLASVTNVVSVRMAIVEIS